MSNIYITLNLYHIPYHIPQLYTSGASYHDAFAECDYPTHFDGKMTFHNQDRDIHTSYHSNSNFHVYHQHHDEIEYEALNHCELHISYHNQDEYTETPISKTLVQTYLRIPSMDPVMLFQMLTIIKCFTAIRKITYIIFSSLTIMNMKMNIEIGFPRKLSRINEPHSSLLVTVWKWTLIHFFTIPKNESNSGIPYTLNTSLPPTLIVS